VCAAGSKKAPSLTIPQVQVLLCRIRPRRAFDAQAVLELVVYWPQRNRAAYVAHRKRRIAWLNQLGKSSL
jgi:hypothetical protein